MQSLKRREYLRAKNLCTMCGKRPPVYGYDNCNVCKLKQRNSSLRYRESKSVIIYDSLIDRGLITVKEAMEVAHVSKPTILKYIKDGILTVKDNVNRSFYLSELEVQQLSAKLPMLKCLDCGHQWRKLKFNSIPTCSVENCRSYNVIAVHGNNTQTVPTYKCSVCNYTWKAVRNTFNTKPDKLVFRKPSQCPKCNSHKWCG